MDIDDRTYVSQHDEDAPSLALYLWMILESCVARETLPSLPHDAVMYVKYFDGPETACVDLTIHGESYVLILAKDTP